MVLSEPFANCGTICSANSWANAALYCKTMQITFKKLIFVVKMKVKLVYKLLQE